MIVRSNSGNLSGTIRDFKRHTSTQIKRDLLDLKKNHNEDKYLQTFFYSGINNTRNGDFQFWQQHNHPIELSDNFMQDQRLDYTHNNPVVAGFVNDPCDWKWSSARSYELGEPCQIELDYIG